MTEIATIKVMYKPGKYEMIINECDFDKEIHELTDKKAKAAAKAEEEEAKKKAEEEAKLKALMGGK